MATQKVIHKFIKSNIQKHFLATGEEGYTIKELAKLMDEKYTTMSRTLSRMVKEGSKYPLHAEKDGTVVRYSLNNTDNVQSLNMLNFWNEEFIPNLRATNDPMLKSIRDTHGGDMKSGGGYQYTMKKTIEKLIEMGYIKTE